MAQRYSRVDPRQLTRFMRQPDFASTVSSKELSGMDKRVMTAKWQPNERLVYDAVLEGYTSMDSLPIATGLSEADIREAVAGLVAWGAISEITVEGY